MKTLLFIVFQIGTFASACIWQSANKSGASPYWPSNNIEVCFTRPNPVPMNNAENPLDFEYRQKYQEYMNLMKRTVEAEFNARTPFNFHGFSFCPENESSNSSGLPPKIRIDLNDTNGGGAMASSIGPRSAGQGTNITISSLDEIWPNNIKPDMNSGEPLPQRVRQFNRPEHMSWVVLHEMMHLMGFHHSETWDQNMSDEDEDIAKVVQFGSSMDEQSIMTRSYHATNSLGLATLSERDVACLTHVANKTMTQFPDRPAAQASLAPGQNVESPPLERKQTSQ